MDIEKTARKYVQDLKGLYTNVSIYAVVSIISFLVWLSFGGAGFWPIWVFVGFGAAALLQGITMGSVKQLEEILPFLKPEWEEQQVKKLLKKPFSARSSDQKAPAQAAQKPTPQKEAPKVAVKAEAPKVVAKKAPVKKEPAKKKPTP